MEGREDKSHAPRTLRTLAKPKSQVQDESIMGTNNSSIVSKRSVERLYFSKEPHFFRYFVKKPQRRSPLINRGYWLRMRAIDRVVHRFLQQHPLDKAKVVINLGCGYDPLPWQCFTRYSSACEGVTFVDIDYRELMLKKRDAVTNTTALNSMLTNMQIPLDGDVLLRSDEYLQLGCDLRDLNSLEKILASTVNIQESLILLVAEVSITYMDVEAADALIRWTGTLPHARFCLLEQLLPEGINHPFAKTMMAHFDKLQTPLKAVQKYPTTTDQCERFKNFGWPIVSVCNLWELWGSSDFASISERKELDKIEPFDEWEEFALFGCHYFLLIADTTSIPSQTLGSKSKIQEDQSRTLRGSEQETQFRVFYEEYPKAQGCNRFAAALQIRGQNRSRDAIGVFGGMGQSTRINSVDIYNDEGTSVPPQLSVASSFPSSRMCHTITDIGDEGALLVGGRTSPDNALADCWIFHKWLNLWERVDDLPVCLYRHQAVHLGCGHVLVSTGRLSSSGISSAWYIWSRRKGWIRCIYGDSEQPAATYGASLMIAPYDGRADTVSRHGVIAGGLSADGLLSQAIWRFEVKNFSSQEPIIAFEATNAKNTAAIARFGASVIHYQGRAYLVGGVVKDHLLSLADEIRSLDLEDSTLSSVLPKHLSETPRPLLIGVSVANTGSSFVITGGSAVCFSFGTFWNKGCYTVSPLPGDSYLGKPSSATTTPVIPWRFIRSIAASPHIETSRGPYPASATDQQPVVISRVQLSSAEQFCQLVRAAEPVILEQLDIGSCTLKWTSEYLKEKVGSEREVIVHEATTMHMSFKAKNFAYTSKTFGDFLDQIDAGENLYLRSLSSDKPSELPANIATDFPTIAADFSMPPELRVVTDSLHSSPLRISGPVIMWLHYDVMANILCQVRGSKRLLLFPPSDIKHFDFEPGASSSHINVFEKLNDPSLAPTYPHEALLRPGDILFLPPFWLHTALPTSGVSIAVNAFFRNFRASCYALGKDVYGNRDLQAYEKGRQDIAKIIRSFDGLPMDVRGFYLQRLGKEFAQKAL